MTERQLIKKEKELAKREELLNQQEESFKTKQLGYFFLLALMIIGLVSLMAINVKIVKEINETERVVYRNN